MANVCVFSLSGTINPNESSPTNWRHYFLTFVVFHFPGASNSIYFNLFRNRLMLRCVRITGVGQSSSLSLLLTTSNDNNNPWHIYLRLSFHRNELSLVCETSLDTVVRPINNVLASWSSLGLQKRLKLEKRKSSSSCFHLFSLETTFRRFKIGTGCFKCFGLMTVIFLKEFEAVKGIYYFVSAGGQALSISLPGCFFFLVSVSDIFYMSKWILSVKAIKSPGLRSGLVGERINVLLQN